MKRIAAFLLVVLIALPALFAGDLSFKLAAGQSTSANLDVVSTDDSTDFNFNFDIDVELDIAFTEKQGMMVNIHPFAQDGGSSRFGLGLGYLFTMPINNRVDMVVTAGPEFEFGGSAVDLTLFARIDFDFYLGKTVFVRVGTGVDISFGPMNEDFCDDMEVFIPLPALAVGWRF